MAKLISLVALTMIRHDGKAYEAGDPIKLPEQQAAQLVASGSAATETTAAVQAKADAKGEAAAKTARKAEAEREAADQAAALAETTRKAEAEAAAARLDT